MFLIAEGLYFIFFIFCYILKYIEILYIIYYIRDIRDRINGAIGVCFCFCVFLGL